MNRFIFAFLTFVVVRVTAQDIDRCKTAEPVYLNRMPGFYISNCSNSDYNEKDFVYYAEGKAQKIHKGGKYYEVWYTKIPGQTVKYSSAQVRANYANAILKVDGKVLSSDQSSMPVMMASMQGKEVTVSIVVGNSGDLGSYHIFVIESEPMKQDIAVDLKAAIAVNGKAAIYGILFDVGKSDIKPESESALGQILAYLNANVSISVIIVGHTDNTGSIAGNMVLSKARAESIRSYLINKGIAAGRLQADGVGQLCPVSTNDTEEGKKLNRRVEIVKL
ncbi:MAG: OmpA family protein [Cyclobacteriaceae bacterium]|jgi:outer membrane protein OmpA-like peptidoglycan-associated protein|nr:hypothetical protein [Cytophagales bacterium]HNP78927.1 OmpA family protein [Cyclobacteriaceae bacterium]